MENEIELDDTAEAIAHAAALAATALYRIQAGEELESCSEHHIAALVRAELADMVAAEAWLWQLVGGYSADFPSQAAEALVSLAVSMVTTGTGSLAHLDRIHNEW